MRLAEQIVDRLPRRWWKPGNLYSLPFGDWHLCAGPHPVDGHSVRTVEWRSRALAHGRKPFEFLD
jgi:hypothetical protein